MVDPARNDIVVHAFSHCSIASGVVRDRQSGSDHLEAIGGNTNTDGSHEGYDISEIDGNRKGRVMRIHPKGFGAV